MALKYSEFNSKTLGTTIADSEHTHNFSNLTLKPSTVAGYGITDAYTKTEVNSAITSATPSFNTLTGKPTTLSGYGITDAATSTHNHDANYIAITAKGVANGVASLDASAKITGTQLPLNLYFEQLAISTVNYTNNLISSIIYTTGNKKTVEYTAGGDVQYIKYYDTDGTTLLKTNTFVYDGGNNLISSTWA